MGKIILISLLIFSFTFQAKAKNFKAKYLKNYDGDTITVNLNCDIPLFCKKMSIRVNGIDTPEIKGNCDKEKILSKEAKYFVALQLKSHREIDLRNCKKGMYFRLVCDVYYNDILLSQKLLNQKLAVKYDGGKKTKNWCN